MFINRPNNACKFFLFLLIQLTLPSLCGLLCRDFFLNKICYAYKECALIITSRVFQINFSF